eukprot:1180955-Prorocentrum_minimum.AAC.1
MADMSTHARAAGAPAQCTRNSVPLPCRTTTASSSISVTLVNIRFIQCTRKSVPLPCRTTTASSSIS